MRWLRRILLAIALLLLAGAGILVASAYLSLDRSRAHAARTQELPLLSGRADGLVRIDTGGLVFRARVAGLANPGPPLVLLHGFPETSAMWIPLLEAAAAEGYRVLAFDQRGYSPGARPEDVSAYTLPELVGDVIAVADAAGFETFHLAGHDWGCVVGWSVAIQHPDRVRSWSALSIPHPGALQVTPGDEPPAYIRFFQTPWLPELLLSWNGLALMRRVYAPMPEAQRAEYLAVFAEPGALTAALNWYRALPLSIAGMGPAGSDVEPSVLFLWGRDEFWVDTAARGRQRPFLRGPYEERELDAGHWLMQEQPGAAVEAVMAHLRRVDGRHAGE